MSQAPTRLRKGANDLDADDARHLEQASIIAERLTKAILENPQMMRRLLTYDLLQEDEFVTLDTAMQMSGLKKTMIYQLVRANKFPRPVKPGGVATRFVLTELREWQRVTKENREAGQS